MKLTADQRRLIDRLAAVLEAYRGRYAELGGTRRFDAYLAGTARREDEELLTEPVLADLLEQVLGFPRDAYFPQLGRSGLKPDFTPIDLVAHPFVLDAKSSAQALGPHEPQIRAYVDQRRLDYGVLFNLRELRVYRRGRTGHVAELSFPLSPLWQAAKGEAIPGAEVRRFAAFHATFRYHLLSTADKVERIRRAPRWAGLEARGERLEIDVDYLVDRLRELSRALAEDAATQEDALLRDLELDPGRERALVHELRLLALDIAPGTDPDALPATVDPFRLGEGILGRAWRQYLLRVAQLALVRVVLYRSWEDVEFVDERLYDGAFGVLYDRLGQSVRAVLREAFAAGYERYRWLFGADNNYHWYRPREDVLVDVLYALVPVPLGKLDADVLGGLYESYVDDIDRDRLGQFYTPRAVVRFMMDRAGFTGPEGVFDVEGDRRRPRRVLDFATGSGGFVVEAARRIVDEVADGDERALTEGLVAIARGITGSEISPFPYYLSEVNLLLQVSRLLGALRARGAEPGAFVLGMVHADTLGARAGSDVSLSGLEPGARADVAELVADERFGLVPLDPGKREAYRALREDGGFDLVVGNPPYVFETGNRVLFDRLRGLPGWRGEYRGKSDYLYYFLILAAEKVAPGGTLCVITPAGWMNAGNAAWLRERLAGTLRLDELFLFGSHRLFAPERGRRGERRHAPTPTVESAILLARREPVPRGHELKIVALEDESAAARTLHAQTERRVPDRDRLLAEMARRAAGRAGRAGGIHVHRLRQHELVHDRPWPIKHARRDVAAQVVAHLDSALAAVDSPVEPLARRWAIFRGIETAADAYTERIQRRLGDEVKRRLEEDGRRTGDPILELPPGREDEAPWREHPELLARNPEPRAVLYGAVDDGNYTSLVWIGREDPVAADVVRALEPWRPVLATRAGFEASPQRRWFETHRTRDRKMLHGPKVIALYRTDRGRFALDEDGTWQPSTKATLCTPKEPELSVAYLCGLLNSELLDLWYAVRGKTPWHVRRNYEPKPMAPMPYRHVVAVAAHEAELRGLEDDLAGDPAGGLARLDVLLAHQRDGTLPPGRAAAALALTVRAIAANRRTLVAHRPLVTGLGATVKDVWRRGPVTVAPGPLVAALPAQETISVRLDPDLALDVRTDGRLGRSHRAGDALRFTRARQVTAEVTGPPERVDELERVLAGRKDLVPADLGATLLPKSGPTFGDRMEEVRAEIGALLDHGADLAERAERLVCGLYGVPAELEDAVVDHARARAARSAAPDEG